MGGMGGESTIHPEFARIKPNLKGPSYQKKTKPTPEIPKIWVKLCGVCVYMCFLKNNILNGVYGCRIS